MPPPFLCNAISGTIHAGKCGLSWCANAGTCLSREVADMARVAWDEDGRVLGSNILHEEPH